MTFSCKTLLGGIAAIALATPAIAADRMTDSLKQQYLNDAQKQEQLKSRSGADGGAIGATQPSSGPGVQGPPGTRTGPAAKAPDGAADSGSTAAPDVGGATTGASSGESGQGGATTTQPSQDSSGVQGFPDTRTGPATKAPGGSAQ